MQKPKSLYPNMMRKVYPGTLPFICLLLLLIFTGAIKFFLSFVYEGMLESFYDKSTSEIVIFGTVILGVIILSGYGMRVLNTKKQLLSYKISYHLQEEYLGKAMDTPLQIQDRVERGTWITHLTSDCNTLSRFLTETIMEIVGGSFQFGLAIIYGLYRSPKLTLIIMLLTIFSFVIPKLLGPLVEKRYTDKQEKTESIRGHILDSLHKLSTIRAFEAIPFFEKILIKHHETYSESAVHATKASAIMHSVNIGVGFLMSNSWILYGIYMVQSGEISLGVLVGFINLFSCFTWPFLQLSLLITELTEEKVSYKRLYISTTEEIEESPGSMSNQIPTFTDSSREAGLYLENLSFSYGPELGMVFERVNYMFPYGRMSAIVGESGKGKSTLIKLIMGLYIPSSGVVWYKDTEKEYQGKSMYDQVSYVPPEYSLFSGSIRENIAYGNPEASDSEIRRAAQQACAEDFILSFTHGYDTVIGDDGSEPEESKEESSGSAERSNRTGGVVQLSLGQAVRIALARAYLKRSNLLILDELTAPLDTETSRKVIAHLSTMNKTVILITHDKELAQECTRMYTM